MPTLQELLDQRRAAAGEPGFALPAADEDEGGGFGGFLGSIAGGAAGAFRGVVPQTARDIAGKTIQNTISGERFLNTVGGVAGNDDLGTDISDKLRSVDKIGGLLAIGFDVAAAPATILTAGFGSSVAGGLAAGRLGVAGRAAALAVEPVTSGNIAQRFAAEAILGTGVDATAQEVSERLEGANPVLRGVVSLAAGAVGGTTALRVTGNKLPGLVGRQIDIDPDTSIDSFKLDRAQTDLRLSEVISAQSAEEVLENVGFAGRLKQRVSSGTAPGQKPGFAERLMDKIMPKDPEVQALVRVASTREQAHNSWVALRMVTFDDEFRHFSDLIDSKTGDVTIRTNSRGEPVLTPEQTAAVQKIQGHLDESIEWERRNGLDPQELVGERRVFEPLQKNGEATITFADMFERATGGHYFPREVTEVNGVKQVKGRLDPFTVANRAPGFADDVPEALATLETNLAAGTQYGANVRQAFEDRLISGGRRGNAKWFSETASDPLFGGRTIGEYVDQNSMGTRQSIAFKSRQIAADKLKLEKLITKKATAGKEVARARRLRLDAKRLAKTISSVETQELRTLDAVEAIRLAVVRDPITASNAREFRRAKGLVNRPVAKVLKATESGLSRLQEASDRLDNMTSILDDAFEAKLLSEADVASQKLKLEKWRSSLARDKAEVANLKSIASQPEAGRVTVPKLGGRSFPESIGRSLNNTLTPGAENTVVSSIGSFNNTARALMAALDLSAAGIQGLMALGTHPIQASKAMFTAWHSMVDPRVYADVLNSKKGTLENFIKMGGHFANDDTGEFAFSMGLRKIKGLGTLFDKSNMAFTRTGNLMRLTMFEQAMEARGFKNLGVKGALTGDISTKEAESIVRTINAATGFSNGKVTSWEKMSLFAPRFFRSQLDLASKALVKGGPDADYARTMMFRTFMLGAGLTMAANSARGQTTEFNPLRENADGSLSFNSNFMRIKDVGGKDVSVFGAWDSLLGLMTTMATQGPIEGLERLFKTKASPLSSTVQDIVRGETFEGQSIDLKSPEGLANAILTESLNKLPFTAQDTLEGWRNGEWVPVSAAFNFFGVKASPQTLFEQRDMLAQQMFDEHWTDLSGEEKQKIEEARPQLFEDIDEQDQERAANGDVSSTARLERAKVDTDRMSEESALGIAVQSGRLSINDFTDRMNVLQASSADQKRRIDSVLNIEYSESTNPNQRALSEWYDLSDAANIPGTGIRDWELWEQLEASFLAEQTPEARRFIEERSRSDHAPEVDWFYKAKDVISTSGYYETVDSAFDLMRPHIEAMGRDDIDSYSDLLNALAKAKATGDVSAELQLDSFADAIQRTSGAQKELLRIGNPALDQALLTLGRVSKPLAVQP